MKRKVLFAYLVLITCSLLLIGSYTQWKGKLASFNHEGTASNSKTPPISKIKKDQTVEVPIENKKSNQDVESLLSLTKNQDKLVQDIFRNRLINGESVNLLITGSNLMDYGEPGYAERLKNALEKAYGEFINVDIIGFNVTSQQFYDMDWEKELTLTKGFDIILFEPFTLKNNGLVSIEDEHSHINAFRARLSNIVTDSVLVLHPANPIYSANYYPQQINALGLFAETEGIPIITHWDAWPDPSTEEILTYLDEKSTPNSEGAEVWSNALITYFIAE